MRFIKQPADDAVRALQKRIGQELAAGKRVLWLFSGGSNIPLAVQVMDGLPAEHTGRLVIMPVDERYGTPGHADSNLQQLMDAGFRQRQGKLVPVLNGSAPEETAEHFAENLERYLHKCDFSVCQLGMGPDGHVAGILPHTPAVTAEGLAVFYHGTDGRERVTATFSTLSRVGAVYLLAYGENKQQQLLDLRDKLLPLDDQPAQILKQLSGVNVYNDLQ